jgi:hypothetical protein
MKLFVYKVLIIAFSIFVIFHLTFGLLIKEIKKNSSEITSSKNILVIKDKLRKEIKNGLEKKNILNKDDAKLLKELFYKLSDEINNSN